VLALPLAVIAYFKFTIAPPSYLAGGRQSGEILAKLLDLERYRIVLGNFLRYGWTFGDWAVQPLFLLALCLLARGVDRQTLRSAGWLSGAAILMLMTVGYFFVYVLTPLDLQYHLDSSLPRLLLQLWPSFLLMVGMAARAVPNRLSVPFVAGSRGRI
jgi:hypothetical protein